MPWSDGAASGDGVTLASPCSSRLHPGNQHTPVVPPYCVIYIYIYIYIYVCVVVVLVMPWSDGAASGVGVTLAST